VPRKSVPQTNEAPGKTIELTVEGPSRVLQARQHTNAANISSAVIMGNGMTLCFIVSKARKESGVQEAHAPHSHDKPGKPIDDHRKPKSRQGRLDATYESESQAIVVTNRASATQLQGRTTGRMTCKPDRPVHGGEAASKSQKKGSPLITYLP
jgi:hypothetical protein